MKAAIGLPAYPTANPQTTVRPWVAELTGTHPRARFTRRFLHARWDHQAASDTTKTGVIAWWTLQSGRVYEARYLAARNSKQWTTRFITATDDGDILDLTEEEVNQWLSACSASTS